MTFLQGIPVPEHVTATGGWFLFLVSILVLAIVAGAAMTLVARATATQQPADIDTLRKAA
jgi:hypothetical protein